MREKVREALESEEGKRRKEAEVNELVFQLQEQKRVMLQIEENRSSLTQQVMDQENELRRLSSALLNATTEQENFRKEWEKEKEIQKLRETENNEENSYQKQQLNHLKDQVFFLSILLRD